MRDHSSYEINVNNCPLCKGQIVVDNSSEEHVCGNCGYVVPGQIIDQGREWREFSLEAMEERRRTGTSTSLAKFDRGLSTVIGSKPTDAFGAAIEPEMRETIKRLREWDRRAGLSTSQQKNLSLAMRFLSKVADRMHMPEAVREETAYIYRKALANNLIKGRSISGIISGAAYTAYKKNNIPVTLDDMANACDVPRKEIGMYYRKLYKYLDLSVPTTIPSMCLSRIVNRMSLKEKIKRIALQAIEKAQNQGETAGKKPMVIAAAALYAACVIEKEPITQDQIADAAGITAVSLRKRYDDIRKLLLECKENG